MTRVTLYIAALLGGCASLPEIQAYVEPTAPVTTDALRALVPFEEATSDPSEWRGAGAYTYKWFRNEQLVEDLTENWVPAERTEKGQLWQVEITPVRRDKVGSPSLSPNVTIGNSAPRATVSVDPSGPGASDDLEVVVGLDDPDGDEVTYTVQWLDGGAVSAYTGDVLPATATEMGDVWTALVTPTDGENVGEAVAVDVSIGNGWPRVESVILAPDPAREQDVITAVVDVYDPEGDPASLAFAWVVNGIIVQQGAVGTLDGDYFDKGDEVEVEVTPSDASGTGEATLSAAIVVQNTAPSVVSVAIEPAVVVEATTASCVGTGWDDVDGDPEAYRVEWVVNGLVVDGATDTLDGAEFGRGDFVECRLTPDDGEDVGTTVDSGVVEVQNTAPVLSSASVSPSSPSRADEVTGDLSAAYDADGDAVTGIFRWFVNGVEVSSEAVLPWADFAEGDEIYAIITATDGTDDGDTATTPTVTAVNAAPSATVTIGPATVYTNDSFTASATTEDRDGDSVTVSYAWYVNGVAKGSDSSTLDGSDYFDRDDVVYVVVTPTDGANVGDAAASDTVTVANSAPTGLAVDTTPSRPVEGASDLQCVVDNDATDADDDSVTYTVTWTVDGIGWSTTSTTDYSGDTVSGAYTAAGEVWECTMTPSDGTDSGTAATASVDVAYPFASIAAGKDHTCAVDDNGEIVCWGDDDDGQATAPSGTWDQVDGGGFHSCALGSGALGCWGNDGDDQASPPSGTTWAEVRLGHKHSCARDTSGAIRCWGRNLDGSTTAPSGTYSSFDVGDYHGCALDSSGATTCWGRDDDGEATPSSTAFAQIAAGGNHTCARDTTGALECWGRDTEGESTPPSGTGYTDVTCGQHHCCALDSSGVAQCWGSDSDGQASPPSTAFAQITAGWYHTCAIDSDGVGTCWGDDSEGQSTPP